MEEKHRVAIQGLPPWQDTCKFLNDEGRTLLKKQKERLIMSTTNWHLPSTSTRIKSYAGIAADFQQPLKGVRVKCRNEAFCALGKTGRTGLQIDIFRSQFDKPNSCIS